MNRNTEKNIQTKVRDFLDSDSGYATVSNVVLAMIAMSGIMFVMATMPNVFQVFSGYAKSKQYTKKQLRSAFYNLKRRKLIEVISETDDKVRVKLTLKGKERIREFSIDSMRIEKPKKWDNKWRVLIFDVPNRFGKARSALRNKIVELGFYQLQKSVWVYPHPCEEEILFIAELFHIEPFVEILTVDNFLHENKVKMFFEL